MHHVEAPRRLLVQFRASSLWKTQLILPSLLTWADRPVSHLPLIIIIGPLRDAAYAAVVRILVI